MRGLGFQLSMLYWGAEGAGVVTTVLANPYLQEWLREPRPR